MQGVVAVVDKVLQVARMSPRFTSAIPPRVLHNIDDAKDCIGLHAQHSSSAEFLTYNPPDSTLRNGASHVKISRVDESPGRMPHDAARALFHSLHTSTDIAMHTTLVRNLLAAGLVVAFASSAAAASLAMVTEDHLTTPASQAVMDPPLVNWVAPQFFQAPQGAFSSDGSFGPNMSLNASPGMSTKAARTLATFIPVTPCRLVDTRGLFNPVFGGPAFAAGEHRDYLAAGNCGIPAGSNRVIGVSLAVTTLPTPASGDVEVIASDLPLGNTVLMVIQAGLWNSADTVSGVNSAGSFQIQVRSTPANLAIDVNGYYAQTDSANTTDFFSILGNFNSDGGLLDVEENGTIGAAIRAVGGGGTDVRLAQGTNAINIVSGGVRAAGAGVNTDTFAFIHQTAAGNICTDAHFTRIENAQTFSATANLSGLLLFAQQVGNVVTKPVSVVYQTGTTCAGGSASGNGWFLHNDATTFGAGESYNIMVITN
jgi:hypothetical protein